MLFQVSQLYYETINSKEKVIVHQGGTSSGKSYAIIQVLFTKAIEEPNQICTVVGQDVPNLRKGVLRDSLQIYNRSDELKKMVKDYNKSTLTFTLVNGSQIEFVSFDSFQDAKGGRRDYLFCNEVNGIDYAIYWQLAIRTRKQIYVDYNPHCHFWVHDKLIGMEGVKLIISNHNHNPFLEPGMHREIENIPDREQWNVYARGLTGNLQYTIYPNWKIIDEFPKDIEEIIWGVDYGYTNDPTAIVKIAVERPRSLYVHEICYKPGLTENQIFDIMTANGYQPGQPFYSEHDVNMISALRRLGMIVYMANKGEGSVRAGIQKVKEFSVYYTRSSANLHSERGKYQWAIATNQNTGEEIPTNVPGKTADHLLDAIRYAVYSHLFGQ